MKRIGTKSVGIVPEAVLALSSHNRQTGVFVTVGALTTAVVPVIRGELITSSIAKFPIALGECSFLFPLVRPLYRLF